MTEPERWNPNDMLELDHETQWQSIVSVLGDTACTDQRVIREPSAVERDLAHLTRTFRLLPDPTNTVALQAAPEVPPRRSSTALGRVLFALAVIAPFAFIGAFHMASVWVNR